jgi:hypothetical protein
MLFLRRGNDREPGIAQRAPGSVPPSVAPDPTRTEESMAIIRHPKDFFAGLMFVAFGVAAIAIGSGYPLGTAARMGPGYFPRILGILLIVIGAIIAARGFKLRGTPIRFGSPKPMTIVLGSVVLFGFLSPYLGLILAGVMLIVVSSAGSSEFRWKEALVSGIVLSIGAVLVFIWGLGLQFAVWPPFLTGAR